MARRRHTPDQIVRKLHEGEKLLNEGKDLAAVLKHLEISEPSWNRWRLQYGGMKADEAKLLKELERENGRLKKIVHRDPGRAQDPLHRACPSARRPHGTRCREPSHRHTRAAAASTPADIDMGSGQRDVPPRAHRGRDRRRHLLRRPPLTLATRDEREHERLASPVLPQGHRSLPTWPCSPGRRRSRTQPSTALLSRGPHASAAHATMDGRPTDRLIRNDHWKPRGVRGDLHRRDRSQGP